MLMIINIWSREFHTLSSDYDLKHHNPHKHLPLWFYLCGFIATALVPPQCIPRSLLPSSVVNFWDIRRHAFFTGVHHQPPQPFVTTTVHSFLFKLAASIPPLPLHSLMCSCSSIGVLVRLMEDPTLFSFALLCFVELR
ncbi:hypothetical protein HanPI659440_Chr02g0046851 [Helianthus annuus]|nr:hypothetical protein HanPI659440_Chr02g0046851 [Helianthus annuus]